MGSLELYSQAARHSARTVIADYSTSFGLATNLLRAGVRSHIKDVYALVRVADEIVDGAAAEAVGKKRVNPRNELDLLEAEVYRAMETGFSTNLVVHAFALTANEVEITRAEIAPFFESMRMDLTKKNHTPASFKKYVYGSAEVVGLMCLRAFLAGRKSNYTPMQLESLELGALALGAAFQKINFLRDLHADFAELGRSYFPGVTVETFNEEQKQFLVDDIAADLIVAANSIPLLPRDVRPAVSAAQFLFGDLTAKVAATPAEVLISTRIRVSNPRKLWLLAKALLGATPR
ncbi:MAG: phytoene/squalene synthase family protein [Micrococcales bacterium]